MTKGQKKGPIKRLREWIKKKCSCCSNAKEFRESLVKDKTKEEDLKAKKYEIKEKVEEVDSQQGSGTGDQ